MSGDTGRVDAQTVSPSSQCGLSLILTSQRQCEQQGLLKLGHEPVISPADIRRAFVDCQTGRFESRSEIRDIAKIHSMANRKKSILMRSGFKTI